MSLLIKGMKMPRRCEECFFCVIGTHCSALKCHDVEDAILRGKRYGGCPLVELPDHGDLIEKKPIVDAFAVAEKNVSFLQRAVEREVNIKFCQGVIVGYANAILAIDNAPVVIPAERSEDGGE